MDGGRTEWERVESARAAGARIISTNGCFDGLHPGHVRFLQAARDLGDLLVVALNSDASVRHLKGDQRPIFSWPDRRDVLLSLRAVDVVVQFDEPTPEAVLGRLRPHRHCKGGDWRPERMPETPIVRAGGGEVVILPRRDGHSSTRLHAARADGPVAAVLREGAALLAAMSADPAAISAAADELAAIVARGGRLWTCGNGGSAADAQHFAAELVGRFSQDRRPFPAVALSADATVLTALGNDYGFDRVFARQVEALVGPGDALIAITTSGQSPNVCAALTAARAQGAHTLAITGAAGCAVPAARVLAVPGRGAALVQQGHRAILHALAAGIEGRLS
jgi:D-sedoheptulose 7-phosphate isomerase